MKLIDRANWSEVVQRVALWLNPATASPSAPLETGALVDAYGPSLMPRSSVHQGMMAGLGVLMARATTSGTENIADAVIAADAPLSQRLGVRAAMGGVGVAAALVPETGDETLWRAGLRSGGWLLANGAIGGALYDVGTYLDERFPSERPIRPLLVSAAGLAGVGVWAGRRLAHRKQEIARWPTPQKNTLGGSMAVGVGVAAAGSGFARGFGATRRALIDYLGPGPGKRAVAGIANAALWAVGAGLAYNGVVGLIGRANEKVEAGYAIPPASGLVSGSTASAAAFDELGSQGRRYVTDTVTPTLIEEVMHEQAKAEPIRTFVGYNTEPLYPTGRAEIALTELDRTGAFDRSHLLLVSPTGTGWVDQTMIESAEFLTRGDIATCCIQYGRYPSFLSVQKVALGRQQFRALLWGVSQRLLARPPEQRPRVFVFGESLGAWASSDVVMFQGITGFDHYLIDRALWVGLPGLAKWSRNGMIRGSSDLVPDGTVGVFDEPEQLAALPADAQKRLRAVILSHDNDPIAVLSPDLLIKEPDWLGAEKGRGVPADMRWAPLTTFWQTAIDAMNAMVTVPGKFGSFGHDYRADMARFVRDAYDLADVSDDQMERIEQALRLLDLERSDRIKAGSVEAAPPAPAQREDGERISGGVPLRIRRTRGANWFRRGRGSAPAVADASESSGQPG